MADELDVNSSRVVEGSLYSDLHGSVRYSLGQIGLQPLQCSAKKFVTSFLNNVVKKNSEDVEQRLRHKPVILEGFQTAQRSKKPKRKEMSAREKRIRGIYKISPKGQRYEMYVPLHKLWEGYMQSMLNLHPKSNLKAAYPKLLRADYHGCILNVSRSKCPSYVGTSGILLQETKNAFKIITKDNKLKMIPKANSVFTFELGGFEFTIHGNHFRYRSCERSARKFKRKPTTDL
ncbi:ribonuclease P protein subunit p29-like [Porites lutea]|uniref:ribonuclease P protein subunit p29-like n=1 Tax=Porites lutea TaxID=51062 RepID=UPI003CC57987